jgi:hypothetical protein
MPKNSDIDSIIKMLRSDENPIQLKGGENLDAPADVGGSEDRTTMVIVLGIIAGLVLGALFYYCVMYMPAAVADEPPACESSLKKETVSPPTESKVSTPAVPKRVKPEAVGLKKEARAPAATDAPSVPDVTTKPAAKAAEKKPVKLLDEVPLFSVASKPDDAGMPLAAFAKSTISSSEFKMPTKPLQPSLESAKDVAGNSSAAKLLDANKQLIDATENNRLRQKMMVATDGLAQYKPEVPVARRRGEEANMPLLEKMRDVNGAKIRKITKSKEGPGLFGTPMSIYEEPVIEDAEPAIGKHLKTNPAAGLTMNTVLSSALPY